MQQSHIISNMVYIMGGICWYVFSSSGFYILLMCICLFIASGRAVFFLITVCIFATLLQTYFLPSPKRWPLIRMSNSFRRCIRHTIFGLRNIKQNKSYIFAVSPHGMAPLCSPFLFHRLQAKREELYYSVADILLHIPIMNIFLRLMGYDSVGKDTFKKKLQRGESIYFQPGGFQDMLLCRQNTPYKEIISIPYGWIKYALQYGKAVIPIYNFDEIRVSFATRLPYVTLQNKLYKRINVHLFCEFLRPVPPTQIYKIMCKDGITSAIGRPITFPTIPNPSKRDIRKWHRKYCKRLLHLVNKYKNKAGYPDLHLNIKELK